MARSTGKLRLYRSRGSQKGLARGLGADSRQEVTAAGAAVTLWPTPRLRKTGGPALRQRKDDGSFWVAGEPESHERGRGEDGLHSLPVRLHPLLVARSSRRLSPRNLPDGGSCSARGPAPGGMGNCVPGFPRPLANTGRLGGFRPATTCLRLANSKALIWNWEIFRYSGFCDTPPSSLQLHRTTSTAYSH